MSESKPKYLVKQGISWRDKRAEPGELRSDIPKSSVEWLLKGGYIEELKDEKEEKPNGV